MEMTREQTLNRVIERGRKGVVRPTPKQKEFRLSIDPILPIGLAGMLGVFVLVSLAPAIGGDAPSRQAEPDPVPDNLWSFLISRSGRLAIDGMFRSLELFITKR